MVTILTNDQQLLKSMPETHIIFFIIVKLQNSTPAYPGVGVSSLTIDLNTPVQSATL